MCVCVCCCPLRWTLHCRPLTNSFPLSHSFLVTAPSQKVHPAFVLLCSTQGQTNPEDLLPLSPSRKINKWSWERRLSVTSTEVMNHTMWCSEWEGIHPARRVVSHHFSSDRLCCQQDVLLLSNGSVPVYLEQTRLITPDLASSLPRRDAQIRTLPHVNHFVSKPTTWWEFTA